MADRKSGFCLGDRYPVRTRVVPAKPLEGQYLRLNGLPSGRYVLVHVVNADRRLLESSYDNNASSLLLSLRRRGGQPRMRILGVCPDTEHCTAER